MMESLPLANSVNQLSHTIWNLKRPLANTFLSPVSIELALLLAANGCEGAALAEILGVLGLSSSQSALNRINGWVRDMMERLNSLSNPRKSFIRIANSIWISSDAFPQGFNQDFQRAVGENFSASANSVPGGSLVDQVNSWCAAETEGKIKEILKQPTVLCLVNAVYFKGIWASKFQKNLTSTMEFHESSGSVSPCYMMSLTEKLSYIENREYQAVRLPYRADGDIVLDAVVVLPKEGAPLEMSQGRWARLWQSLCETREVKGTLLMPRFKVESSFELKNDLMRAGVQGLFQGTHELGPMVAGGVQIDEIIHKVVIEVNEEGTEAAAVTAVVSRSLAPRPWSLTCDRPFMFFVCERSSGLQLFMGAVHSPGLEGEAASSARPPAVPPPLHSSHGDREDLPPRIRPPAPGGGPSSSVGARLAALLGAAMDLEEMGPRERVELDAAAAPSPAVFEELHEYGLGRLDEAGRVLRNAAVGLRRERRREQAAAALREAWRAFWAANAVLTAAQGAPSPSAYYNLACVLSLAAELALGAHAAEGDDEDDRGGGGPSRDGRARPVEARAAVRRLAGAARAGGVAGDGRPLAGLPPRPARGASVGAAAEGWLAAAERWLRLALAAGYRDLDHLRRGDPDLRVLREVRGLAWLEERCDGALEEEELGEEY